MAIAMFPHPNEANFADTNVPARTDTVHDPDDINIDALVVDDEDDQGDLPVEAPVIVDTEEDSIVTQRSSRERRRSLTTMLSRVRRGWTRRRVILVLILIAMIIAGVCFWMTSDAVPEPFALEGNPTAKYLFDVKFGQAYFVEGKNSDFGSDSIFPINAICKLGDGTTAWVHTYSNGGAVRIKCDKRPAEGTGPISKEHAWDLLRSIGIGLPTTFEPEGEWEEVHDGIWELQAKKLF